MTRRGSLSSVMSGAYPVLGKCRKTYCLPESLANLELGDLIQRFLRVGAGVVLAAGAAQEDGLAFNLDAIGFPHDPQACFLNRTELLGLRQGTIRVRQFGERGLNLGFLFAS